MKLNVKETVKLKKSATIFCILLAWGITSEQAEAAPKKKAKQPIEITSDGENRYEAGIAYAEKNVVVRYGEEVIYADQITYDNVKKEISAHGNVRIFTQGGIYHGDYILYNIKTKQVTSHEFRATFLPIFAAAS